MAGEEITAWVGYLESRKEEVSKLEEAKANIDSSLDHLNNDYGSL